MSPLGIFAEKKKQRLNLRCNSRNAYFAANSAPASRERRQLDRSSK